MNETTTEKTQKSKPRGSSRRQTPKKPTIGAGLAHNSPPVNASELFNSNTASLMTLANQSAASYATACQALEAQGVRAPIFPGVEWSGGSRIRAQGGSHRSSGGSGRIAG